MTVEVAQAGAVDNLADFHSRQEPKRVDALIRDVTREAFTRGMKLSPARIAKLVRRWHEQVTEAGTRFGSENAALEAFMTVLTRGEDPTLETVIRRESARRRSRSKARNEAA